MKGVIEKLLSIKARYISDCLIGILMATSHIWVDVNLVHRILIGFVSALAVETFLRWLEDRQSREDEEDIVIDMEEIMERKARNRNRMYGEL